MLPVKYEPKHLLSQLGFLTSAHIFGLLVRSLSPLALMEYSRVFISPHLPTSKALGLYRFLKTPVRPVCHRVEKCFTTGDVTVKTSFL